MATLTLQALLDGVWWDAALLEFPAPEQGAAGPCYLEYDLDYLAKWMGGSPHAAASVRFPVVFGPACEPRWPAFLDDIRPLGGARAWWRRRLNLTGEPGDELRLLREGTVAPIGNLRVKESVPAKAPGEAPRRFPRQAVVDREHGFLEYAAEQGAQVGGATGAGGEAPKLLLRCGANDQVWIDTWQDEPNHPDAHYLVKFARGARSERDRVILRSEYVYYRALDALGVAGVPISGMRLEEGENGPSLWLPRFDVARREGQEVRFGVESVYSLLGARPGAYLRHQEVLAALRELGVGSDGRETPWRETLFEYLQRDLLNVLFGNSDNHGRNTALLKTNTAVRFAPIYDFAPMKMDPEGVTRATTWEQYERGGVIDWPALLSSFGPDESYLRSRLHELAERLRTLPSLLEELDLPEETLRFPAIGFSATEQKLRDWSLL